MKNNAIGMVLVLGAASVCALDAQSVNSPFSAKVPFTFQVGSQAFAAGKYVVGQHGYLGVPTIQNAVTGQTLFVAGANHALTRSGPPRLVFHCYAGKTCFLAEIQPPAGSGSVIAMTKAEKALANGDRTGEMATISVDIRKAD